MSKKDRVKTFKRWPRGSRSFKNPSRCYTQGKGHIFKTHPSQRANTPTVITPTIEVTDDPSIA